MKTLNRLYLILAILFAVVGVVQCIRWGREGTVVFACIFNFLPAASFLLAYVLNRKTRRVFTHVLAVAVCVLTLGFWGSLTVGVEMMMAATTKVTDTGASFR